MESRIFDEKIQLIMDPYFDREFFTNLIYLIDRKKGAREIFEASIKESISSMTWDESMDKALYHLFNSYQACSALREGYQWLPLSNALYGMALYRGDGQKLVKRSPVSEVQRQASTPQEFEALIKKEVRAVESCSLVFGAFLFLLENRSTRSRALAAWVKQALLSSDLLTFKLVVKGAELALASGWKASEIILKRPFERFWTKIHSSTSVQEGQRLASSVGLSFKTAGVNEFSELWAEEIWKRASSQSAESVWEYLSKLSESGVSLDQVLTLLTALRGRCLWSMKMEQWPRVCSSIEYAEALTQAAVFCPEEKNLFLAVNVVDLCKLAQLVGGVLPQRPTGDRVLDGASKNIAKDRLVLRLDDLVERGDRQGSLELMAAILKDLGLSGTLADRLLLMASKQDSWTYDFKTLPAALVLTKAYSSGLRQGLKACALDDALYGLLRFLSDEREVALTVVPKTGTYGDGLKLSQFDVSGGARIVDRFVFNMLRNAQRIKVWPSDN